MSKKDQQGEADLFEFFDPLLSPHAYPDGIAPDTKPIGRELQIKQQLSKTDQWHQDCISISAFQV